MRGTIFVLSFAAACFGAQASSIITLGGTPAATPSIVSLGEPAAAVSDDKVAAIPKVTEAAAEPRLSPMVIRGGIAGGPSGDPLPALVRSEPTQAATGPRQAETPTRDTAASSADQGSQVESPRPVNGEALRKPI